MAGIFSDAGKKLKLDSLGTFTLSLHTGDPGTNGTANEISGGSPAYARKSASFGASTTINSTTVSRVLSSSVTFDVPASTTVSWVGVWSGTTFVAKEDVTDEVFAAQGNYTVTSATLTETD